MASEGALAHRVDRALVGQELDVADVAVAGRAIGRGARQSQGSARTYCRGMPEISRFYGIVITINFDDHQPPHFHARYGEHRALIGFDGAVLAGRLPSRALDLVRTWGEQHRDELGADWELARALQPLVPIAPLD